MTLVARCAPVEDRLVMVGPAATIMPPLRSGAEMTSAARALDAHL
jgi:hypothetical protein